jgi:hypothetical protein
MAERCTPPARILSWERCTNLIVTRRPTIAAARCRLASVMSSFALRSRSTFVRLVFSSLAILFFDFFLDVVHARTHVFFESFALNSFLRFRARAKSSSGVVRTF